MKKQNPENMINLESNRKLFIGFNREDYDHLKEVFENLYKYSRKKEVVQLSKDDPEYSTLFNHKLVSKMPKFIIFIILHGDMDIVDVYIWIRNLEYLIYNYDCYNQIKIVFFAFNETTKTFARMFTGNNPGNFRIQGGNQIIRKNPCVYIHIFNSLNKIRDEIIIEEENEYSMLYKYELPSKISKDQFEKLDEYRKTMFLTSLEKLNKNAIYGILDDRK